MVRKNRIRGGVISPKYIAGLGDGHVEDISIRKTPTDDEAVLQKAVQKRRSHLHHASPQLQYPGSSDTEPLVVIFPDRNGASTDNRNYDKIPRLNGDANSENAQRYQHSTTVINPSYDPWEDHAMYLIAATIFVIITGVFLHLLAEGSQTEIRLQPPHGTFKKQRHAKIRKKKTDEWNEDSKEEDLLSESVRGCGSVETDAGEDSTMAARPPPPALYYPYQPRLPQHRHRRNSSSSTTVVVHSPLQHQPQTTAKAVTPNRSYYLNQSGSAVIAGHSPVVPSGNQRTAVYQGGTYCPPSPLPNPNLAIPIQDPTLQYQHANHQVPHLQSIFQLGNGDAHLRLTGNVRPISSTVSSFESLTEGLPIEKEGSLLTPEQFHQRRGSTDLKSPFPISHTVDDIEELTPISGPPPPQYRQYRSDFVDKTPRVANGRSMVYPLNPPVPEDHPFSGEYDPTPDPMNQSGIQPQPPPPPMDHAVSDAIDVDLLFATSPTMRRQQQMNDERLIPFVPSLTVPVADTRPPKSMNVDQLHMFQLMESGNVSHWEQRVAEESRQLESRVFPAEEKNNNVRDVVLAASADLSGTIVTDSIPSDDPRKGINHKRGDLTESTDASSSLQGAIEFTELKLIDVIGGGGFGQVWKAFWRGTPVAVKVLTGSAQSKSVPRPVLEEFAAEINLLKGMRHPNICLYMGACLEPPNRAIITELASNGSLWDALRLPLAPPYVPCDGATRQGWPDYLYRPDSKYGAPPIPLTTPLSLTSTPPRGTWHWVLVKRVAIGSARGLNYLHGGRIPVLHRDLKSANILLDESYTAKVCDFGLSRLKAQERSMTGNCGTVQWMAPEVLANQSYNEKADVYSYGVILWELLTRQCPYDKMTPIQCALAVLNRNQRPEIPKWCPPSFQALIRTCWKKEPDERPTFTQILAALDDIP